jgi:AraC-like DNA-binding protein
MPQELSPQQLLDALSRHSVQIPPWARQASQSVTYPRAFLDAAGERGADRAQVLQLANITSAQLDDPAGKLSLDNIWKLCIAALLLTGDDCLGFASGYRMPLTAHGNLGYALMCSSTPKDAITILERFWHLRGRGVALVVNQTEDTVMLELVPEVSVSARLTRIMLSSILTSMYRGLTFLVPTLPARTELWLEGPTPANAENWKARLPGLRFDMPRTGLALIGDLSLLEQPLPNANPEALTQALAQCERESALLEPQDDTVRQLRIALLPDWQGYPTPEHLASQLHLTPRTLRRRLHEQGQSYQQLLEEARRRDSCRLLADPALEVRRVGELLGYTDPANFTRAFKSWHGVTPSEWRKQQQQEV